METQGNRNEGAVYILISGKKTLLSADEVARLHKAKLLIETSGGLLLSASMIAKRVQLSRSKLIAGFAQLFSMTTYAYQLQVRMQRAELQLLEGELTELAIAEEAGYSSLSNFIVAFKRLHENMTPGIWKQKNKFNS